MTTVLEPELESDPYLISLVRGGDVEAFGRLYERHVGAARRLARVLVRDPSDADDLIAETFTKVLAAMRAGRGPDTAFRAYLFTTMRHTLYDRGRRERRIEYTDDLTPYERVSTPDDPLVNGLESSYAARAFARLPERWRTVLWHTEVEGETPAQVAPLLGLTPNGVAALAYRARERLRQMYLQEHIEITESPRCHWTGTHLAGYVRAQLARRDRSKVEDHLAECAPCRVLHRELTEENSGLRGVLATLLLGSAAPGYLAEPARFAAGWLAAMGGALVLIWRTLIDWCAEAWAFAAGLGFKLYRLPRRLIERYGPGNVAAASGLVAAGLTGVVVFAAVLINTDPEPPPKALPRPAPAAPSPAAIPPSTTSTRTPAPPVPPMFTFTFPDLLPAQEPARPSAAAAGAPAISSEPAEAQLAAAETGTLPIAVRMAESSVQADSLHLQVSVPDGVRLAAPDAGDGWRCAWTDHVRCARSLPVAGGRTVARIRLEIPPEVTGYQSFPVMVSAAGASSQTTLRVPIAPAGLRVRYAATGRLGYGIGANALLTCQPRPACLARDNNEQEMVPATPGGREPMAPLGSGRLTEPAATSGARVHVPTGAAIRWAALTVTTSGTAAPAKAAVHGPGGDWRPMTLAASANQSFADVTDLLRERGGGDWWFTVAAADLPSGRGQWAGWSLAVVYEDPGAATSELAVYLGPKPLRAAQELSIQLGLGGEVDFGLVLWDGDHSLVGDSLTLGKLPLGNPTNAAMGANATGLLCAFAPGDCPWRTPGLDVVRHKAAVAHGGLAMLRPGDDPIEIGLLVLLAHDGR